jgi:peroxiredoxin
MRAACAFGIAIPLEQGADLHASTGRGIVLDGRRQWVLSTPATYLIDQDGRIDVFPHWFEGKQELRALSQ